MAIAAVFCFRAVLPEAAARNENSDYIDFYEPVARSLLDGRGFMLPDGRVALRFPAGYPVIVAGTIVVARAANVSELQVIGLLSAISVGVAALCVFELARRVWPGRRALVAPVLVVTYPLLLWLCKQPNSELPFLALFSASVLAFWVTFETERPGSFAFLAGVLVGLAMLIRPIALFAGVLFAAFGWWWARGSRRQGALIAGMLLLGNVLAVLPWEVWAYARTGKVIPLASGGVDRVRFGLIFAGGRRTWQEPVRAPADVAELTEEIEAHYKELKSVGDVATFLFREAEKRPVAVAKLMLWKAIRPWYATDTRRHELAIALLQIPYLALLAWSGHRAMAQGSRPARLASLLVACCVLFWMMAFLTAPIVRYMVPGIALLFTMVPACLPAPVAWEPDLGRSLQG